MINPDASALIRFTIASHWRLGLLGLLSSGLAYLLPGAIRGQQSCVDFDDSLVRLSRCRVVCRSLRRTVLGVSA